MYVHKCLCFLEVWANIVRSSWGLHMVTHLMDWTVRDATTMSTPTEVNAVLVRFFFDFISFFASSFCVCEDADVTHKVSNVKKNIYCWVCLQ